MTQELEHWAEAWAKDFHETYERLAPKFGYQTREESAVPWEDVPENNRKLMTAVVAEVLVRQKEYMEKMAAEIHMLERQLGKF